MYKFLSQFPVDEELVGNSSIEMECESEPGENDHSISMKEDLAKVTVTTPQKSIEVGHNSLFNLSSCWNGF